MTKKLEVNEILNEKFSKDAIEAINSELDYQSKTWNEDTTASEGNHKDNEFLVFIEDYLKEAINIVSRNGEPEASKRASNNIRKITAMVYSSSILNKWEHELIEAIIENKKYEDLNMKDLNTVQSLGLMQSHVNKAFDKFLKENKVRKNLINIFEIGMHNLSNNYAPKR